MDKLKYWLIPGLIVIIALGGLVFLRGRTPEVEPTTIVEEEESTPPKGFAEAPEPSDHEKVSNDSASMADALRNNDISACEKITWDEVMRQQCFDNLYYAAALRSGNEADCDKIQDQDLRTQCYNKVYLNVAIDGQDLTLCDKISDPVIRQLCRNQVQSRLARRGEDLSACDTIDSTGLREDCQDTYYLKNSIRAKDVSGCDNILDANLKDQCTNTVEKNIAVAEANEEAIARAEQVQTPQDLLDICNTITGERATKCRDAVYPKLALEEKDLSHCEKISDQDMVNQCKQEQGQAIDQFYLREAIATADSTTCDQISSETIRNTCKTSI